MTNTVRKTRRADELVTGDWLALESIGASITPTEIVALVPFQPRDEVRQIEIIYSKRDGSLNHWPVAYDGRVPLATAAEISAHRAHAERAQKIADLRQAIDFLDQRPWLPLPDVHVHAHLQNDVVGNYRTVRELAEREGVKPDVSLDDRTVLNIRAGALYYSAIAWHKDGRPAESEPER